PTVLSTPRGARVYVAAVGELLQQGPPPDAIVLSSSSGGTLAGILTGALLHGLETRVIAISADDPPHEVERAVRGILRGLGPLLELDAEALDEAAQVEVDAGFV